MIPIPTYIFEKQLQSSLLILGGVKVTMIPLYPIAKE